MTRFVARTMTFIVVSIAVIAAVFTSLYTVDCTEVALILRLGRHVRQSGPGLHVKAPLGFERCVKVPVKRVFIEHFGTAARWESLASASGIEPAEPCTMVTGDLNIVHVSWSIQYRISDPVAWAFKVADQQKTIRDTSQSVMSMLIGDLTLADAMGKQRERIERRARDLIELRLTEYDTGVQVITCELGEVTPPAGEVIASFEDVNKAIQDRVSLINRGKQEYNRRVPEARGLARQLISTAEGYAVARENRAIGQTKRFGAVAAQYERYPEVTRTRLYFEAFEQVFSASAHTELIDKNLSR